MADPNRELEAAKLEAARHRFQGELKARRAAIDAQEARQQATFESQLALQAGRTRAESAVVEERKRQSQQRQRAQETGQSQGPDPVTAGLQGAETPVDTRNPTSRLAAPGSVADAIQGAQGGAAVQSEGPLGGRGSPSVTVGGQTFQAPRFTGEVSQERGTEFVPQGRNNRVIHPLQRTRTRTTIRPNDLSPGDVLRAQITKDFQDKRLQQEERRLAAGTYFDALDRMDRRFAGPVASAISRGDYETADELLAQAPETFKEQITKAEIDAARARAEASRAQTRKLNFETEVEKEMWLQQKQNTALSSLAGFATPHGTVGGTDTRNMTPNQIVGALDRLLDDDGNIGKNNFASARLLQAELFNRGYVLTFDNKGQGFFSFGKGSTKLETLQEVLGLMDAVRAGGPAGIEAAARLAETGLFLDESDDNLANINTIDDGTLNGKMSNGLYNLWSELREIKSNTGKSLALPEVDEVKPESSSIFSLLPDVGGGIARASGLPASSGLSKFPEHIEAASKIAQDFDAKLRSGVASADEFRRMLDKRLTARSLLLTGELEPEE